MRRDHELRMGKQAHQLLNHRPLPAWVQVKIYFVNHKGGRAFSRLIEFREQKRVSKDQVENDHQQRLVTIG